MNRVPALLLWLLLVPACAGPAEESVRVAGPIERIPGHAVSLRILEDGDHVDLDLARRRLALYIDSPREGALFSERPLLAEELPVPRGCRWLRVADDVTTISCILTPLGRMVLCRTDDGADVTLADFQQVLFDDSSGIPGLRLVTSPERRNAVTQLTGRAADSSPLFVVDGEVRLAAAVDGPL